MTGQQRTALLHYCYLACETMHPRFHRQINGFSIIVTVDAGYE